MIMAFSIASLLAASTAFMVYDLNVFKSRMIRDLGALAQIIGNNASTAIQSDDQQTARTILSALKAKPHIVAAYLLKPDGTRIAAYNRDKNEPQLTALYSSEGGFFANNRFTLFKSILLRNKKIGSIYIESDPGEFYVRLRYNLMALAVIILAVSIGVFLTASLLQGLISEPILQLVQTTKNVSQTQNYSIELPRQGRDEIGQLFEGFNQMMRQIQLRDVQLTEAKKDLEQRVLKRTEELRKTNEELTQLLSLHDATLEATADGILVVDLKGRVMSYNSNFLKLWKMPDSVAAGGEDEKLIMYSRNQVADQEHFVNVIREHYAHPEESYYDLLELKDGRTFERASRPQKVGDKVVGRVWSFHDITKRKRYEEEIKRAYEELKTIQAQLIQSEKMASIGQLAAGVAHEINNPVGFIGNNLELLTQYIGEYNKILRMLEILKEEFHEGKMEKAKAVIEEIDRFQEEIQLDYVMSDIDKLLEHNHRGIERIQKIVMDLKTFAHEGKDAMDYVKVEDIIDSVTSIVHNELKYKAELVKNYGQTPKVKCSPQRIGQVFINLLVNAAQAIKDKGTIEITTYCRDNYVGVDVKDTGEGIKEEYLKKIFDPFFTTKPVGKGTGLGLSVSHEIIKKHQGDIRVLSKVGEGTTFTVLLPTA
ncbi:MAG: PAS-domain containing protein [Candidatus Omnitrophica bacterium]|nr:PAS-domain containing protein [Candidatus Omnitrophota bacterium]